MKKEILKTLKKACLNILSFFSFNSNQKRLGYDNNSKLLIIHADDFGLTASENRATIEAFGKGMVCSASIMVNCRGFAEASQYARDHPDSDLGLHLTLTSEWDAYRWGPILPPSEVRSLVDENGYFLKTKASINSSYKREEVENELRAQIRLAEKSGINLTHLDSHMFITTTNSDILDTCIKLAKEFRIPLLLNKELPMRYLLRRDLLLIDNLLYARPENYNDLKDFYARTLKSLKPGLNCLIIHTAYDDAEMQDMTSGYESFGSAWRQADFDFFTGQECRNLLDENNIHLITWREVREKLVLNN